MSARIRYTAEDEIVARAGEEEATVLDSAGVSNFLRLLEAADLVVAFGEGSAEFSSQAQVSVAVGHGMGRTPQRIFLTPTTAGSLSGQHFNWAIGGKGASTFSVNFEQLDDNQESGTLKFDWIAIG